VTAGRLGPFIRARLARGVNRLVNARRGDATPLTSVPLAQVLGITGSPLDLVPLLEGRTNPEREAALARHLDARGIPFTRQAFRSVEGHGENFAIELGGGDRVLVLIAHHDAVPVSPGANDNAAAVGILLHLVDRLARAVPRGVRVRLLFTAAEELGYLGARAYVADTPLADVIGVLSLELTGIGDSLAIWDAGDETPFLRRVGGALEGLGLRSDETYHVVGRIPVFGSDHRAFAPAVPAYGLTMVPFREADALRQFVFSPVRSALTHLVRRPPPFDTYHTRRDSASTLDPRALETVVRALAAIVDEFGSA
jgi:Zn-dependent M28 family amino/carboxypeptidase